MTETPRMLMTPEKVIRQYLNVREKYTAALWAVVYDDATALGGWDYRATRNADVAQRMLASTELGTRPHRELWARDAASEIDARDGATPWHLVEQP